MLPLFAYGTLRDPEFQREIFGRTFAMRLARVDDFIVLSTGGGYLAAVARDGATIQGALVALDAAAYRIADAWEDLTVYERVSTTARTGDGRARQCFIYTSRGSAASGPPVSDGRLADRPRAEIITDIRRFRAALASTIHGEQR
jgi:gamma-glutamylcyclotransferase (GGCT)/AIG2-like uncharacterized protein YtfP